MDTTLIRVWEVLEEAASGPNRLSSNIWVEVYRFLNVLGPARSSISPRCSLLQLQRRKKWPRVWRTTLPNAPVEWRSSPFPMASSSLRCPLQSFPLSGKSRPWVLLMCVMVCLHFQKICSFLCQCEFHCRTIYFHRLRKLDAGFFWVHYYIYMYIYCSNYYFKALTGTINTIGQVCSDEQCVS